MCTETPQSAHDLTDHANLPPPSNITSAGLDALDPRVFKLWVTQTTTLVEPGTTASATSELSVFVRDTLWAYGRTDGH